MTTTNNAPISFRLTDDELELLRQHQEDGEKSLNLTAKRLLLNALGVDAKKSSIQVVNSVDMVQVQELIETAVQEKLTELTTVDNVDIFKKLIDESLADGGIGEAISTSYEAMMGQFNGLLEELQELKKQFEELTSVPLVPVPQSPINEQLTTDNGELLIVNNQLPEDENKDYQIEELQLSTNTYNLIKGQQINTVGELIAISENELLKIRGFGQKALTEIKDALKRRLGIDFPQLPDVDSDFTSDTQSPITDEEQAEKNKQSHEEYVQKYLTPKPEKQRLDPAIYTRNYQIVSMLDCQFWMDGKRFNNEELISNKIGENIKNNKTEIESMLDIEINTKQSVIQRFRSILKAMGFDVILDGKGCYKISNPEIFN
ncbi:DNA-directed RNA polymerase subunit alpha C-terminal domain-containing protein [Aphanizomenon flos-aquae]|jgi:hypothetical protein|uniref:RNA polymerase alpha subunit C-terminal domain-containing protein n=1 Tax=Aphanizomenon flos-aquae FACHB-1040 TaxID=2692887 RepID=A0ABR8C3P5_APHFL|nr:DNA-directed RNA polymerase subunit alpha C-terminal domain-containing protein [Aphanizomenon flos-aquae]MBD2281400.1 hypothetical protein [Aphanizomenon flos-aquae FACHB-1040]